MQELFFFDCHASIGPCGPKDARQPHRVDELLAEMRHCRVQAALVTHNLTREYDPMFGNRRLLDELAGSERLFACWVVLPHWSGESPQPEELIGQMRAAGVRAACIGPFRNDLLAELGFWAPLLGALQEADIPLFVDLAGAPPEKFRFLDQVCSQFRRLTVVARGLSWIEARRTEYLLGKTENLCIECSSYHVHRVLERYCERFGAHRLLFGSNTLSQSLGAARALIDYAEIQDEARRLIAGGNLARLLKLDARPPDYPQTDEQDDAILACARTGRRLHVSPVIDAHAHVGHDGAMGVGYITMGHGDIEHMLERNRRIGIEKLCCSSWLGIWADVDAGNALTAEIVARYPDQVVGLECINPAYTPDAATAIRKWHEEHGFCGLKPYGPRISFEYTDPALAAWFEYANEHRLFVLLHEQPGFIEQVARLSEQYPNVAWLLAHSGGSWSMARQRAPLAAERPNVFLELTYTPVPLGVIEFLVETAGVEKVIFGTDAPMRDPIPQFGWVAYAHLDEGQKRKILGQNMQAILQRCRIGQSERRV